MFDLSQLATVDHPDRDRDHLDDKALIEVVHDARWRRSKQDQTNPSTPRNSRPLLP